MSRVKIGRDYTKRPAILRYFGVPLIYLPIVLLPFVALSALITRVHLWLVGARNVKKYRSFVPDWSSYRYTLKTQIVKTSWKTPFCKIKLFWMFNCACYCPYSVGLFAWHTYLVKVVENWWCPFHHSKKETYCDAPIDKSYWHINPQDEAKLHPEDRKNPIWNEDEIEQVTPSRDESTTAS